MRPAAICSRRWMRERLKRKFWPTPKKTAGGLGGFEHLPGLSGVHRERLFAKDGLAVAEGEQGVFEVVGVGAGDEDGVHIGGSAELFGGGEGADCVEFGVDLRLIRIAAPEGR